MKFDAWSVEPPGLGSAPLSICTMSRQPSRARWCTRLLPTMPAPMTTTRAVAGTLTIFSLFLVAQLAPAAGHVFGQLLAHGVVEGRRFELGKLSLRDITRPRRGVLRPVAHPPVVVVRAVHERAVEAGAEPFHGVRCAEEVPAVADLVVRVEGQRRLVDLQRRELLLQHLQHLHV